MLKQLGAIASSGNFDNRIKGVKRHPSKIMQVRRFFDTGSADQHFNQRVSACVLAKTIMGDKQRCFQWAIAAEVESSSSLH